MTCVNSHILLGIFEVLCSYTTCALISRNLLLDEIAVLFLYTESIILVNSHGAISLLANLTSYVI
jgi:hypothetical protein